MALLTEDVVLPHTEFADKRNRNTSSVKNGAFTFNFTFTILGVFFKVGGGINGSYHNSNSCY